MNYDIIRDALNRFHWADFGAEECAFAEEYGKIYSEDWHEALGFLAGYRAALSCPHPEAREEDLKIIRQAIIELSQAIRSNQSALASWSREGLAALARLAAPKPEGQMRKPANPKNPCADCKNGIGPRPDAICDECEGDESDLPSMWQPAAPEPRPAKEPWSITKLKLEIEARKQECKTVTRERDRLRSQLARKGEALRNAIEAYADEANWSEDAEGVRRVWHEPGSTTPEAYDGWSIARAALREPDGRKGE